MMTKYNHPNHQPKSSLLDRIYYSCSVEFWLSIVTIGIAADWLFKFGTSSLLITLAWTGILGTYHVVTNAVTVLGGYVKDSFDRYKIQKILSSTGRCSIELWRWQ